MGVTTPVSGGRRVKSIAASMSFVVTSCHRAGCDDAAGVPFDEDASADDAAGADAAGEAAAGCGSSVVRLGVRDGLGAGKAGGVVFGNGWTLSAGCCGFEG